MKYLYAYKSSDGVRHELSMDAESREAVFAALRQKGIKAIKVIAADGSKANGELRGVRKRTVFCVALITIALTSSVAFLVFRNEDGATSIVDVDSTMRRQVIGDVAIIEKGIRTAWSNVFADEGERFLAAFAVPGYAASLREVKESAVLEALTRRILPERDDSLEARQVKQIVEGLKDELRRFLAAGGSVKSYSRRLLRRQEEELRYRYLVEKELESAFRNKSPGIEELWERRNDVLRQMGIRPVPFPEDK